jgi:hypothetical protein
MESRNERLKEAAIYLLILALAAATRVYGIWEWSLVGDEIFTARHADERWTGLVGPAHYAPVVLIDYVFGLTKWSLRLPNAILGVLSVPLFYYLCGRTFGRMTALAGTALLLVSEWHLLFSQYARYYTGVFLFGAVAYFTYVEALRDDRNSLLVVSLLSCLLGVLHHPTFLTVPLSCAVASALVWAWPGERDMGLSKQIGKKYFLVCAVAGLIVLPWSLEIVQKWNALHPSAGTGGFQVAGLASSLLDLVNRAGIVLSVGAFFGFYVLIKRDVRLGTLFGILAGIPVLAYLAASEIAPPFRPRYIYSFFPLVITFTAVLSSEAIRAFSKYGLARYAVLIIIVVGMLPGFASYYTGKQSLDPGDAVTVLEEKYTTGDKVLAMPIGVNYKISQSHPDWTLIERGDGWRDRVQRAVKKGGQVWIIAPSSSIPGVGQARESWLIDHGALVWRRHAFGYVRAMPGMSIWRLGDKASGDTDSSASV